MCTAKTVGQNSKRQMISRLDKQVIKEMEEYSLYYMARRIHPRHHFYAAEKSAHVLISAIPSVTPMLSTTGQKQHSSIRLLLIVLNMCYLSCPVRNFTGLCCKLVSPLRRYNKNGIF
ncbi:hypothetical protein OUZ56_013176 [Daphnia magna]|uniref:Uncharacterized protein n=1 Tax=Daphnia magna TaxID=35525 RepID=A0ABQ9Z532_9CRUS|nr:hypothetical protein OUZ56_013176 [Daphnia magna]